MELKPSVITGFIKIAAVPFNIWFSIYSCVCNHWESVHWTGISGTVDCYDWFDREGWCIWWANSRDFWYELTMRWFNRNRLTYHSRHFSCNIDNEFSLSHIDWGGCWYSLSDCCINWLLVHGSEDILDSWKIFISLRHAWNLVVCFLQQTHNLLSLICSQ